MNGDIGENFQITQDGMLVMKGRVCVLDIDDLRNAIMEETHYSAYAMHPDSTNMYQAIKKNYWWSGMKRDIVEFVSRCLVPTDEGRTLETCWNSSAFTYITMEVGTHHHRLRC